MQQSPLPQCLLQKATILAVGGGDVTISALFRRFLAIFFGGMIKITTFARSF